MDDLFGFVGFCATILLILFIGFCVGIGMDHRDTKEKFATFCEKQGTFDDRCLAALGIK